MKNLRIFWWDGHKGTAHYDEVWASLRHPPQLFDLDIEQLDYLPERGVAFVKERGKDWRPLTMAERAELDSTLHCFAQGRSLLCRFTAG